MSVLAFAPWQQLLNGLGWCLAQIYSAVPNYALAIIILTVIIRLLLLPFGFKQIKSMQHMQALQPELKQLQKKYKNNKQKLQEEQMQLYREAGVNPLGGCLPLLLTLPFLFAMYAVIRPPLLSANLGSNGQVASYQIVNNHLPEDSTLFYNVLTHQNLEMAGINLQCSLATSGTQAELKDTQKQPIQPGLPILGTNAQPIPNAASESSLDCGTNKFPDAIPYVLLLVLMLVSAIFMQRQMTKANPTAAQAGPQAALMKYMPLIYVVWGWAFPAGLILYWTTANGIQIAQQTVMLRAGHIGPDALERAKAEQRRRQEEGGPKKKGFMGWMNEKAQSAQNLQDQSKDQRGSARDGKGQQKSSQQRKPQGQRKPQQKKSQVQNKPKAQPQKPQGQKPQPQKPQGQQPPLKPDNGSPQADGSTNGDPTKPIKGAKPGNQLRPKRKQP
ncbi:MAG TPA: membrane protein insertase YidC [Actinomycetota bacterium]|nr:membrane protein insertase YidC [Actinomycetota bacterium]